MPQSQVSPAPPPFDLRPACPQCGRAMLIARIDPVSLGVDERTFECHQCNFSETALVNFR